MSIVPGHIDLTIRSATKQEMQMNLRTITDVGTPPRSRAGPEDELLISPGVSSPAPRTPPESLSGSPSIHLHGSLRQHPLQSPQSTPRYLPPLSRRNTLQNSSSAQVSLPSLSEFDQGVEDLARRHHVDSARHQSIPALSPLATDLSPSSPQKNKTIGPVRGRNNLGFSGTVPRDSVLSSQWERPRDPLQETTRPSTSYQPAFHGYDVASSQTRRYELPLSPPPDQDGRFEGRHINKKYRTEEGDFIIYMWHDRGQKWQDIKRLFANQFGATPERTVQGLQAWYYRMNQSIPEWDRDGWLVFEDDYALEPKQYAQKCRERDSNREPHKLIGLEQRYPERAIGYDWVDPETKARCQDWANKRLSQYHCRKERRKAREAKEAKGHELRCVYEHLAMMHERRRSN
ncbi:hypothetical protein N3K66_002748 [Trichothecium roseum]|uniref:Uncharacterized protein n=1 Tax=Trichothecium roseum TaxID=47278 RepID=A0ACC0VC05_9HYPO|nr:hypothetical protein N3K66_002748 [Trichothecium roseum]